MPDVGSDELLRSNDEYHFLFAKHYENQAYPSPEKNGMIHRKIVIKLHIKIERK